MVPNECCDPDSSYAGKTMSFTSSGSFGEGDIQSASFTGTYIGNGIFEGTWVAYDNGVMENWQNPVPKTIVDNSHRFTMHCTYGAYGPVADPGPYYGVSDSESTWDSEVFFQTVILPTTLPNAGYPVGCQYHGWGSGGDIDTRTESYTSNCMGINQSGSSTHTDYNSWDEWIDGPDGPDSLRIWHDGDCLGSINNTYSSNYYMVLTISGDPPPNPPPNPPPDPPPPNPIQPPIPDPTIPPPSGGILNGHFVTNWTSSYNDELGVWETYESDSYCVSAFTSEMNVWNLTDSHHAEGVFYDPMLTECNCTFVPPPNP